MTKYKFQQIMLNIDYLKRSQQLSQIIIASFNFYSQYTPHPVREDTRNMNPKKKIATRMSTTMCASTKNEPK